MLSRVRQTRTVTTLGGVFTGIVREVGTVKAFDGSRLVVEAGAEAAIGDSVAIAGVCLTVTGRENGTLAFDVVAETLDRTTLGRLVAGARVNVEPSLRAGDPLGGHIVQGHVDGIGNLRGRGDLTWFDAPPEIIRYCVEKGSIAVDGTSLTVAAVDDERLRGRAHPAHARGDDARRARTRRPGQPRGRRAREIRRTADNPMSEFASVEEAIEEIRAGRMVVVVDDPDRENEGDLVCAAEFATDEAVNFMATHARGLICLCLTGERCEELGLPPMTQRNEARLGTAFTVSVEAREGVTTGISAADRAHTIAVAIDPKSTPHDLVQPGHIFPLRARDGGVLVRAGQTEAAVDLARLAGLNPAGVVCEIMNEDGTMARVPDLVPYCERHGLQDDHRRRPHRVPPQDGEARRARRLCAAPDGVRRVHGDRLPRDAHRPRARRARAWGRSATTSSCASTPSA